MLRDIRWSAATYTNDFRGKRSPCDASLDAFMFATSGQPFTIKHLSGDPGPTNINHVTRPMRLSLQQFRFHDGTVSSLQNTQIGDFVLQLTV